MNKLKALILFKWEDDTFNIHNLDVDQVISEVNTAIIAGHNFQIGEYRYDSVIMTSIGNPYLKDTELQRIINEIIGMKEYLANIITEEHLNKVINYMSLMMRGDLIKIIFQSGIKSNESMVRNAICNGRIDMAEVMIEEGAPLPKRMTLFDLDRRLNWEPDRIRFLIKHAVDISFTDKEKIALNLLYPFFKKIS